MAGGQLDTRRFAEEVFVPVRDGWDVGHNLFRFFQLPLDVSDDAVMRPCRLSRAAAHLLYRR